MKTKKNYDDIINYEYRGSVKHKHMSLLDRAAQFAPFEALTGYEDEVKETARIVDSKIELSEESKEIINKELNIIKLEIQSKPFVNIIYFIPDEKKQGGKYVNITERALKIDEHKKNIIMADGITINFDDISEIRKINL